MSQKGLNPELLFIKIFAVLPLPVARGIGAAIGWLLAVIPARISRPRLNTTININQCFPDKSDEWRAKLVRRSLVETGKTISEFPYTWTRGISEPGKGFNKIHNQQLFQQAIEGDRPLLILAPHISNWERLGQHLTLFEPMTMMYRKSKNTGLDEFVLNARTSAGMKLAHADLGGIKFCLKEMKQGRTVAILPDHAPNSRNNPYADFFGIPALTTSFISQLCWKANPVVLAVFAHRLPDNHYDIHFMEPDPDLFSRDLATSVQGLNKTVEQCVMKFPEQYNWPYKRFARRPGGQPKFYRKENMKPGNYQQYLTND